MVVFHTIIPARFIALTAHFVLNVMLYWSREGNIKSCVAVGIMVDSPEYNTKDDQFVAGLTLSLLFTIAEFIGFFSGLSLFTTLPNMFSTSSHVAATICLSLFTVQNWSCDDYWYIFSFCSIPSFLVEILVIIATVKFKLFN